MNCIVAELSNPVSGLGIGLQAEKYVGCAVAGLQVFLVVPVS